MDSSFRWNDNIGVLDSRFRGNDNKPLLNIFYKENIHIIHPAKVGRKSRDTGNYPCYIVIEGDAEAWNGRRE
jgi:hypothetical protein